MILLSFAYSYDRDLNLDSKHSGHMDILIMRVIEDIQPARKFVSSLPNFKFQAVNGYEVTSRSAYESKRAGGIDRKNIRA